MKICIDAGHNFSSFDTGAQGNGLREQDITFGISSKLKPMLEGVGVKVIMTRTHLAHNLGLNFEDSLSERCRIANNNECDLLISIHCNSHTNKNANGTEVLVYKFGGEAEKLAEKVQKAIVDTFGTSDRGVKEYNAKVLRNTNMPAILVETAFISNSKEAELLKDKQNEFAKAIYKGVRDYLGLNAKQTEKTTKISSQPKIESGNDIDYALKWKYGITFESLANEREFIKELDEARGKDSKLYWVYYKLANK
jgi:N-acetylmuramoyl-L-alanine amidase